MSFRKECNRWAPSQNHLSLVPLPCQLEGMLLIPLLETQVAELLRLHNPAQILQMDLLGCC